MQTGQLGQLLMRQSLLAPKSQQSQGKRLRGVQVPILVAPHRRLHRQLSGLIPSFCPTEMSENTETELAELALSGRRFEEAERRFTALLKAGRAADGWSGLAMVKLGLLSSERSTAEEVIYCYSKLTAVAPERESELAGFLAAGSGAIAEDMLAAVKHVRAIDDAAWSARVSGFAMKGLSYFRATSGRANSPTLFTNVDALHDSYRGSLLLDRSVDAAGAAAHLRTRITTTGTDLMRIIEKVLPAEDVRRKDLTESITEILSWLEPNGSDRRAVPPAREIYLGRYRSSDQRALFGVCGGLAHRWGRSHALVQLMFCGAFTVGGFGLFWYLSELARSRAVVPTKGVPRPSKSLDAQNAS